MIAENNNKKEKHLIGDWDHEYEKIVTKDKVRSY